MCFCFFFNDTATTEIYTLSLHDALPILLFVVAACQLDGEDRLFKLAGDSFLAPTLLPRLLVDVDVLHQLLRDRRSEEHTSELQSRQYLVCRLLLEKKKKSKQSLLSPTAR